MNIEFRDLHWAIVAAQHRSLRQAAEALNVRQSTLSRRMRALEGILGAALFLRTSGGTRPTIAGDEFLCAARRLVDEVDDMRTRFRFRARGESGCLTIGVHASLTAGNLRATLIEHRQRFPRVNTSIVDGSSRSLFSDLANFSIDLAFIAAHFPAWNGGMLPIWSERVVVAVPDNHPLASQEVVRWEELKRESLLVPLHGPGAEFISMLVGLHGSLDPSRFLQQAAGLDRLLTLVNAGWGILLALEGATGANYPGVVYREVHDAGETMRLNFFAYWRNGNTNPSLQPLLDMLRERYPDLSSGPPTD